jgi:hypothetical protein
VVLVGAAAAVVAVAGTAVGSAPHATSSMLAITISDMILNHFFLAIYAFLLTLDALSIK